MTFSLQTHAGVPALGSAPPLGPWCSQGVTIGCSWPEAAMHLSFPSILMSVPFSRNMSRQLLLLCMWHGLSVEGRLLQSHARIGDTAPGSKQFVRPFPRAQELPAPCSLDDQPAGCVKLSVKVNRAALQKAGLCHPIAAIRQPRSF